MCDQFSTILKLIRISATVMVPATGLVALTSESQTLTPGEISSFKDVVGSRVETSVVLAGDQGISAGNYSQASSGADQRNVDLHITKFGGAGDVGDPVPLGGLPLRWQPRLQGSMGYLTAKNDFNAGLLQGDESEYKTFAIQFGGGARFWFNDHLSLAPTIMGMYGHTENDYTVRSAFAQANFKEAKNLGLIDWTADTWTVIPAGDMQYVFTWRRTIFTFSSDFTYYHTESFHTSNQNLSINGNSESWKNMIDVDIPLGKELFGHELRTGGFFSRTEFYDDLQSGLNTDYMYEAHGRLVLDFLGKLWKVKWIGIGGSYLWGGNFNGWTVGADVAFKF